MTAYIVCAKRQGELQKSFRGRCSAEDAAREAVKMVQELKESVLVFVPPSGWDPYSPIEKSIPAEPVKVEPGDDLEDARGAAINLRVPRQSG